MLELASSFCLSPIGFLVTYHVFYQLFCQLIVFSITLSVTLSVTFVFYFLLATYFCRGELGASGIVLSNRPTSTRLLINFTIFL